MGSSTAPYYGAPVVVWVLADGGASTFVEDGSCVLENMMLAALGLVTVWMHRERDIFDSEKGMLSCGSGSCRKPCAVSGRLHWGIQPGKPVNPQHANKTISFGFNDPAVRRNFLRRTLCGEEGKYADE